MIEADHAILYGNGYLCCWSGSGLWLEQHCNQPHTNSGIAGWNYVAKNYNDEQKLYLMAGKRESIQIKEIEFFQIATE